MDKYYFNGYVARAFYKGGLYQDICDHLLELIKTLERFDFNIGEHAPVDLTCPHCKIWIDISYKEE
jgi:hypothetical protein